MIFFHSEVADFPRRLAEVIKEGWYADMKSENTKYVIFQNKVLKYDIGNQSEKEAVLNECRSWGIPEDQLDWSE